MLGLKLNYVSKSDPWTTAEEMLKISILILGVELNKLILHTYSPKANEMIV